MYDQVGDSDMIVDGIMYESYQINIASIDAEHDISMGSGIGVRYTKVEIKVF